LLLKGADVLWRSRLLSSMARQTRHLARSSYRAETGYDRLMTAAGLVLAALCLPGCDEEIERGAELLRRELRLQIRPDGGHVGRNPSQQLALVIRLQMISKAFAALGKAPPGFLSHTLGRAAAHVGFFRVGDGGLAVFNGGSEDDPKCILAAAEAAEQSSELQGFAPHSGYQRLAAGRAIVIADTSLARGAGRFESAGSLHFSTGRHRLVVNCGSGAHLPGEWSKALVQAAAHSALGAEGAGAGVLQVGALLHRRAEDSRGQLLEIERLFDEEDRLGPRALRRLFLSAAGDNLRGEDTLIAPPAALASSWRIRFHLHPDVKASQARDGKSVILSVGAREGWRFRTNAPEMRLERSVYLGRGQMPQPTEQIVLSPGALEPADAGDMLVRWAFQRLDGAWAADERSPGL
ncbi:MAG: heparinase II/III family protein, partial [Parvularculaceae bacterium]|nr:heparinase II/III family protein [Parvularculaceae bacterium]